MDVKSAEGAVAARANPVAALSLDVSHIAEAAFYDVLKQGLMERPPQVRSSY